MGKYRTTTLSDYLIDAATLETGETLYVKCDRNITVADMQAALNAQYGSIYKATSHGSARYIWRPWRGWWNGETEVNSCEQNLDGSYVHKKSKLSTEDSL